MLKVENYHLSVKGSHNECVEDIMTILIAGLKEDSFQEIFNEAYVRFYSNIDEYMEDDDVSDNISNET